MSHHTAEVVYLLNRAASLDAAVRNLSAALEAPSPEARFNLKGIVYKALSDQCGFSVTLHGVTLRTRYDHVLDRTGDCPELFGRLHLCLPDDGLRTETVLLTLLIADTGDYSDDGTLKFGYSTYDLTGQPSGLCRHRLSLAIAAAVQASLAVLPRSVSPVQPSTADALYVV